MGFMSSHPSIYQTMNWKGEAASIVQKDVIAILETVASQLGLYWDADKIRLSRRVDKNQLTVDTPWCHKDFGSSKRCGFDHHVCFNTFGIIPPRCLECWKTVVTPNTFEELIKLRDLQTQLPFPCKCGIELRDYTPKFYGGYHYADSYDEGMEQHRIVKKYVKEHISKEVADNVILKRGCTEYEMIKGPSPAWHMNKQEERLLEILEHYVYEPTSNGQQAVEIKNHTFLRWILWAHMNGDFSYLPWNDGEKLFPDYVRYDDKDPAVMKQEMALARAAVQNGISAKDGKAVLADVLKSAKKHKVNPNAVFNMGFNTPTPTNFTPPTKVPDTLKGEHDELS
jgi:hypothetical protein